MLPKLVPTEKMLITYYSRTGNTREIAHQIHKRVGGDIIELKPVEPYPEDYEETKKRAMQELNSGSKPVLKTKVEKIGPYDVIFVGTPIWYSAKHVRMNLFTEKRIVWTNNFRVATFCR